MAGMEVLTFGMALAWSIPPIPSNENERYSATPTLIQGGVLFLVSLLISRWRVGEAWVVMASKLAIYLALVWAINERVFIFS